jgi:hypothetical protein
MDEIELRAFHAVLITLACQIWTLSCVFRCVPLATDARKASLAMLEARLKKISRFLLIQPSLLEPNSTASGTLCSNMAYEQSQYTRARTALQEIFGIFSPAYALCFALHDYNGTDGTGRKNDPFLLVAKGYADLEILLTDNSISEILSRLVADCETRVLDILSELGDFAERLSAFYPDWYVIKALVMGTSSAKCYRISPSLPEASQSGLFGEVLRSLSPEYIVRISEIEAPGSLNAAEEINFSTDPNRVVVADLLNFYTDDHPRLLRVPFIDSLQLQDIGQPSFIRFNGNTDSLELLHEASHALVYLALSSRGTSQFSYVFGENWTSEDDASVGMLLLQDKARVSIAYGRIKARNLFLFENCLVIARQKDLEHFVVHRVSLADLLQVRYRSEDPRKGKGILKIYWKESQSTAQGVCGAEIFFNNTNVLTVWAAFLAVNASTELPVGST